MTVEIRERSPEAMKRLARCAGAVYVALGVASAIGFFHAPVIQGDLGALGRRLIASDLHFRIGLVTDMLSAVLAVPLALLLFQLFEPVHRMHAAMMALLLVLAVPISFVVALDYVAAQWLLAGAPGVSALADADRQALGMLFLRLHTFGVLAVEIFWGLWLLPFGLLARRSHFLPPVLGVLLIIAGMAYVAHSLTTILLDGQRFLLFERITLLLRASGELPAMFWLLIKGVESKTRVSRLVAPTR